MSEDLGPVLALFPIPASCCGCSGRWKARFQALGSLFGRLELSSWILASALAQSDLLVVGGVNLQMEGRFMFLSLSIHKQGKKLTIKLCFYLLKGLFKGIQIIRN